MAFDWFLDGHERRAAVKQFPKQLFMVLLIILGIQQQLLEPKDIILESNSKVYSYTPLSLCRDTSSSLQVTMPSSDADIVEKYLGSGLTLQAFVEEMVKKTDTDPIVNARYNVEMTARFLHILHERGVPTDLVFPVDMSDDYFQIVKTINDLQEANTPGLLSSLIPHALTKCIAKASHKDLPREFLARAMDEQLTNYTIEDASCLYHLFQEFAHPRLSRLDSESTLQERIKIQKLLSSDPYTKPYMEGIGFQFTHPISNNMSTVTTSFDPQANKRNTSTNNQTGLDKLRASLARFQAAYDLANMSNQSREIALASAQNKVVTLTADIDRIQTKFTDSSKLEENGTNYAELKRLTDEAYSEALDTAQKDFEDFDPDNIDENDDTQVDALQQYNEHLAQLLDDIPTRDAWEALLASMTR